MNAADQLVSISHYAPLKYQLNSCVKDYRKYRWKCSDFTYQTLSTVERVFIPPKCHQLFPTAYRGRNIRSLYSIDHLSHKEDSMNTKSHTYDIYESVY